MTDGPWGLQGQLSFTRSCSCETRLQQYVGALQGIYPPPPPVARAPAGEPYVSHLSPALGDLPRLSCCLSGASM